MCGICGMCVCICVFARVLWCVWAFMWACASRRVTADPGVARCRGCCVGELALGGVCWLLRRASRELATMLATKYISVTPDPGAVPGHCSFTTPWFEHRAKYFARTRAGPPGARGQASRIYLISLVWHGTTRDERRTHLYFSHRRRRNTAASVHGPHAPRRVADFC